MILVFFGVEIYIKNVLFIDRKPWMDGITKLCSKLKLDLNQFQQYSTTHHPAANFGCYESAKV
jgi:hypothetical protein